MVAHELCILSDSVQTHRIAHCFCELPQELSHEEFLPFELDRVTYDPTRVNLLGILRGIHFRARFCQGCWESAYSHEITNLLNSVLLWPPGLYDHRLPFFKQHWQKLKFSCFPRPSPRHQIKAFP